MFTKTGIPQLMERGARGRGHNAYGERNANGLDLGVECDDCRHGQRGLQNSYLLQSKTSLNLA